MISKSQFNNTYNSIISIENLLEAWKEFVRGKRSRKDVQEFESLEAMFESWKK